MPNALIYSPSFDGHRQIYVFVLAHVLNELGFNLYIAGDSKTRITNSFYIDKLKENENVTFVDTSIYKGNGYYISNEEFVGLQNECKTDLTIFTDADNHISLFNSQIYYKKSRLRGRTVGIFLQPYYSEITGAIGIYRFLKNFKSKLKSDDRLFHELFLKNFKLLDAALFLDENFVSRNSYRQWLPDVFQQYAETLLKDENFKQRVWIDKLNDFKELNKDRFIFLYFGAAQKRRGYDLLLKMAVEQNGCFIHCGLNSYNEKYDINIDELRKTLSNNNRLMETHEYITDPQCIEYFFKSVSHLVLPYRNVHGSSGVMLQALSYGIPVLVPDFGIIGSRVKRHNLGLTFNTEGLSLEEQFKRFIEIPKGFFYESIMNYMHYQSIAQLKKVLVGVFNESNCDIKLP